VPVCSSFKQSGFLLRLLKLLVRATFVDRRTGLDLTIFLKVVRCSLRDF
jgi:hypothetical protein